MMSPAESIVGVVLAGGASRRMGRDKATLLFEGETLAARAARKLAPVVATVVIADRNRGTVPGFPSVEDGPGAGPAAALLGAAAAHPGAALLVLACDLPHLPVELLRALLKLDPEADLILPRSPRGLEPLCGLYRPRALAALAERVAGGELALHSLVEREGLRTVLWAGDGWADYGDPGEVFANWNGPGDVG